MSPNMQLLQDFIGCGIKAEEAAKYFKYCLGDELPNTLKSIAGGLILDSDKLRDGITGEDINTLRYITMIMHHAKTVNFP